jgi:hypothetical protein
MTTFQLRRRRNATQRTLCDAVSSSYPKVNHHYVNTPAVQDCPKGYPLLAAFLDSDDNFMIYRRFGYLQARLLLEKQEELRRLEEDLDILDSREQERWKDAHARDNPLKTLKNGKKGKASERRVLVRKIEKKFRGYGTSN